MRKAKEKILLSTKNCPECGGELTTVKCICHRVCMKCKIEYRVDLVE